MSRNRRNQRWQWLSIAIALAVVPAGCGGGENPSGPAPGAGGAGGAAPNGDAGFEGMAGAGGSSTADGAEGVRDNPVGSLVADPGRSPWDFVLGADMASETDYADLAGECYSTPSACSAVECGVFAACCVDNGTCCEPVDQPALPESLDFQICEGLDIGTCAAAAGTNATVFGPDEPQITSRGLIPNGNASSEGGATIGGRTDLGSRRVRVDVEFTLPIGCGASCLESAGVAFTGKDPIAFVDVEVGLLLSGSRNEVSLMIGDTVIDAFGAGFDQTRWSLIVSPEGKVEALRDGQRLATHSFDPSALRDARFVVFGRNLNDAPNSAAIARFATETSFCDIPGSWLLRGPVSVFEGANEIPEDRFGRGPSVESDGVETRVAYVIDDEVFWAAAPQTLRELQLINAAPALSPTEAYEAQGIADPELVWDGANWHLFYTARSGNETSSIGHAIATPNELAFTADPSPTLSPTADELSLDAPTVHRRDGLWVLIARATVSGGATELRAYYTSALGTGWERVRNGALETLTRVEDATAEVTEPSLMVHNSAYQLYYSRRTGTRWAVELIASDELLLWRPIGEVLGAGAQEFEQWGARGADVISLTDRIDVVYEGHSGIAFQLGSATRAAPSDSASDF